MCYVGARAEASTPRSERGQGQQRLFGRRASLAGTVRASSTRVSLSGLAQQLRRHSGDAYAVSQRLLSGALSYDLFDILILICWHWLACDLKVQKSFACCQRKKRQVRPMHVYQLELQ